MRALTWLLLITGAFLAANCLVWGTSLVVCCVVGGSLAGPPVRPEAARPSATPTPLSSRPAPSPSVPGQTRTPSPTRTATPAPTYWIVNPTASWPTRPTEPPTPVWPTPTPPSGGQTPTPWPTQVIQGGDAETKGQALMALAANGPNIPFRVTFTASEIEWQVERTLAQQPDLPYRNVRVTLTPQEAIVSGQVSISGLWVGATVHAGVTVEGGKLVVTITRLDLGFIPLPPSVQEDLNRKLAEALSGAENLPFRFTAITLGDGQATIEGVTK